MAWELCTLDNAYLVIQRQNVAKGSPQFLLAWGQNQHSFTTEFSTENTTECTTDSPMNFTTASPLNSSQIQQWAQQRFTTEFITDSPLSAPKIHHWIHHWIHHRLTTDFTTDSPLSYAAEREGVEFTGWTQELEVEDYRVVIYTLTSMERVKYVSY